MPAADTALLLIDVQQSFTVRPYWDAQDVPAFLAACNTLIAGCLKRDVPIVRVFHVEDDGAFALASGLVRPLDGLLAFAEQARIDKHVHNAFTDTGLDRWLRGRGIRRVLIAGIRSEQCCETSARVASDLGYEVDFVSPATLTFAMRHPLSGAHYSAADIRARTELVLAERFAQVCSVEQALARLDAD